MGSSNFFKVDFGLKESDNIGSFEIKSESFCLSLWLWLVVDDIESFELIVVSPIGWRGLPSLVFAGLPIGLPMVSLLWSTRPTGSFKVESESNSNTWDLFISPEIDSIDFDLFYTLEHIDFQ